MLEKAELITQPSIFCYGNIDHEKSQFLGHQLQQLVTDTHEEEEVQSVTFHINSQGGNPFAGKQIGQYLGDLIQLVRAADSCVEPQIFVRDYAISAAAVLLLYARSYGVPVYAESSTEVRFHDFEVKIPQALSRADLKRTLEIYDQEVANIERLLTELTDIKSISLEHEIVFKGDDLLNYNLIDDFVQ